MAWFSKNRTWISGAGFFILSSILRFIAVNQTPHPSGWDGYYYVMQVHSWLTYGYLQSPDFSLIYPYLAVITYLAGDTILGFKIGVAIISGLLVVAVYYGLLKRSLEFSLICVACGYLLFSPLITYFVLQFPKNALGLVFLVLLIANLRNRIIAVVLLVAAVMTHRMIGGFAVIAMTVYFFRFVSWKWLIGAAALLVAVSFLPGIIHISDLQRFEGQFTIIPHWAPLAFARIFPRTLSIFFKAELILISVFVVFLVIKWRVVYNSPWVVIALVSTFPFFAFSPGDIGHRFFLIAPVAFIMLIPPGSGLRLTWAFVPVFVVLSLFSWRSYKPYGFDPPNKTYSKVVDRLITRYKPSDFPLVIAHKSLAEMIIFKTDFDALNWLPPEDMQPQYVLRLTKGVKYSDFRRYLDADDLQKVHHIIAGYAATPEDVWQKFVQDASKASDRKAMKRIYSGFNPMDRRPYFINKGKIR